MMKVPVCQNAQKNPPGDALKTAPPGAVIAGNENKLRFAEKKEIQRSPETKVI